MDSAYIGRIGSLIPVMQFRGGSSLDVERQSTHHRLLSGAIRVQVAPVANREWSCSVPYRTTGEQGATWGPCPPTHTRTDLWPWRVQPSIVVSKIRALISRAKCVQLR